MSRMHTAHTTATGSSEPKARSERWKIFHHYYNGTIASSVLKPQPQQHNNSPTHISFHFTLTRSAARALFCHCWLLHTLLLRRLVRRRMEQNINIGGEIGNWRRRWSWDCIFNYFPLEHFKVLLFSGMGMEREKEEVFTPSSWRRVIECEVHSNSERDDGGNLISFRPIIPSENCRSSAREL